MKINLECNELRPGYLNTNSNPKITQMAKESNIECVTWDPRSLDGLAEDHSVEEIIVNMLLNRIFPNDIMSALSNWIRKLQDGGRLIITFIDIRKVCKRGFVDNIKLEVLHRLIFGKNNENQSICDTMTILGLLKKFNLKINLVSYKDDTVIVEAQK